MFVEKPDPQGKFRQSKQGRSIHKMCFTLFFLHGEEPRPRPRSHPRESPSVAAEHVESQGEHEVVLFFRFFRWGKRDRKRGGERGGVTVVDNIIDNTK